MRCWGGQGGAQELRCRAVPVRVRLSPPLPPLPSLIAPIRCTTIKRRYSTKQKSKRSSSASGGEETEEEEASDDE